MNQLVEFLHLKRLSRSTPGARVPTRHRADQDICRSMVLFCWAKVGVHPTAPFSPAAPPLGPGQAPIRPQLTFPDVELLFGSSSAG
jgi:hypothetical protein